MNEELYKERIMEYYKDAPNKEEMYEPDIKVPAKNVSCGDSYILYLKLNGDKIKKATFSGIGCVISQVSASMLTEKLVGLSLKDASKITKDDIYKMLGVEISIGREKCALLLWNALKQAVKTD
jgi:nitrogen fixation NifU-like protein